MDTTKRNICILLSICKCKVYRYSSRSTVFSLLFPSKLLSFLYLHMYEVVGRPATLSCESPLPCHTHQHLIGRIHGAIVAAVGRGDRRPVYTPYKSMFLRVKYSGPAVAVRIRTCRSDDTLQNYGHSKLVVNTHTSYTGVICSSSVRYRSVAGEE